MKTVSIQSQLHIFAAGARTVVEVDTILTTRIISRSCDKNATPCGVFKLNAYWCKLWRNHQTVTSWREILILVWSLWLIVLVSETISCELHEKMRRGIVSLWSTLRPTVNLLFPLKRAYLVSLSLSIFLVAIRAWCQQMLRNVRCSYFSLVSINLFEKIIKLRISQLIENIT